MKRVVSVSLGTSARDKVAEVEVGGVPFRIERIGTDGDLKRYAALFSELDGKVDALGIGGADLDVRIGERRYRFRQIARLVAGATKTPVVDGGGLKHTLEREAILTLQREGIVDFRSATTLLVSAVDRFGMAQALAEQGGKVIYGDLLFGLGLPFPLRRYEQVRTLGAILLPLVTKLPFKWVYPTGEKQLERKPKHPAVFAEADVIAGDWHYIRRFAPDSLPGKTVLTQTLRRDDLELLRKWGVARAIATTPVIGGETFATNVMEGVLVALAGRTLDDAGYREGIERLGWRPTVLDLSGTFSD